jgi:hypothetical protein
MLVGRGGDALIKAVVGDEEEEGRFVFVFDNTAASESPLLVDPSDDDCRDGGSVSGDCRRPNRNLMTRLV